jgi:hypothetical protein
MEMTSTITRMDLEAQDPSYPALGQCRGRMLPSDKEEDASYPRSGEEMPVRSRRRYFRQLSTQ